MKIADNIRSVLIIDNKEEEVSGLKQVLDTEGTYYTFYTPEEINNINKNVKNHQIIFMDFSLDDTRTNPAENISLIRKILKELCRNNFGSYGLILWTKHLKETDNIQLFKEKLSIDATNNEYTTPLFVVGLDKSIYLEKGYSTLWEDLNNELLKNNAALFFFNWRNSIEIASDKALNNMYQLVPEYEKQPDQFPYLLYQIAKNYSGIPTKDMQVYDGMYKDAYRAFDELLYSDLITQQIKHVDIFPQKVSKPDYNTFEQELKQTAKINSRLLLDLSITDQTTVMPGNVYKVVQDNTFLKLQNSPKKRNCIPIAIEMTPPCDFSHKKVSSRLIGGFMIDCPTTKEKLNEYVQKTFKADSKYLIWPIEYDSTIKFMCFDFRNIDIKSDETMKDASAYKLLFMVKHRLFADILQKFSSHAARLGLSIIQPTLE